MEKFKYALYTYLTTIQSMDEAQLKAANLDTQYRDFVLEQAYPLSRDISDDAQAAYCYAPVFCGDHIRIENPVFKFDANDTQELSVKDNISLAAHEVLHSFQVDNFYKNCTISPYKTTNYMVTGMAVSAFLLGLFTGNKNLITKNPILSGLALSMTGLAAEKIHEKMSFYQHEKEAMQHEGYIEWLFGRFEDEPGYLRNLCNKIKEKTRNPMAALNKIFGGYPNDYQTELYIAQGNEMASLAGQSYDREQIAAIKKKTDENIKSQRFRIYDID